MTKRKMNNSGITLIALVLTIIVLLILAGVSIAMLSGDNSILNRATTARENSEKTQIEERIKLAYHAALTGGQGSYTKESIEEELEKEFGENNYNVDDSDSDNWILTGKVKEKEQSVIIPAGKVVDTTWQKAFEFPEYHFNRYELDDNNKTLTLRNGPPMTAENVEIKNYAIIDGKKYTTKFPDSLSNAFALCTSVKKLKIDPKIDMSNLTNLTFSQMSSLEEFDMSDHNFSNIASLGQMFAGCSSLKIVNLSGCDFSNVTSLYKMFIGCSSLERVDMSNCKTTDKLVTVAELFKDCSSLTTINLNNFNLGQVNQLQDLFNGCHKLTDLQISNWNTENVVNMERMFASCYSLQTIDLSSFDTKNLESARWMFDMSAAEDDGYQAKLKTIYASEKFILKDPYDVETGTRWENMFSGCTMIEGGEGTTFDSTKIYGAYAHIDGGTENPGYFTAK